MRSLFFTGNINKRGIMRDNQRMVCVTDVTKVRLEELKLASIKNGERKTLGGIVDHLVKEAYDRLGH